MKRRPFLKNLSTLSMGAGLMIQTRKGSANDRVVMGAVGFGGRGQTLVKSFALREDVQFAVLSDPVATRGDYLLEMLRSDHNPKLERVQDFRRVLDNKDVDAVVVATPDHWHALPTIWGCQAGKDIYVEKSPSLTIWEGRKMVEAARKYNRIVQVGTQTRSCQYALKALDFIRNGGLGDIPLCKVYNLKSGDPYKESPTAQPPQDVDWNLFQGPAPMRDYHQSIINGGWLYYWDYCGGDVGNDGVHQMDLARMLIGKDYPKSVYSTGGNFAFDDDREVTDTQVVNYEYDDMLMTFELTQYTPYMAKTSQFIRDNDLFPYWPQNSCRVELYGTKALMIIGRHGGGWQVFTKDGDVVAQEYGRTGDSPHKDNFMQCIKSRELPNADIEEGHRSAVLVHLANISYRLGQRKLLFDPQTETITNDPDANKMLRRPYREPFVIQDEV